MSVVLCSIVVPYKNTASGDRRDMMLELCRSIPDRSDLEVVWVNDNSDADRVWVDPAVHAHTRHVCVDLPAPLRFPGRARDFGVSMSQGRWVMFVDSDDLLLSSANALFDRLVMTSDEVDVVVIGMTSFQADGGVGSRHVYLQRAFDGPLAEGNSDGFYQHVSPCGKVVRRVLLGPDKVRFDDGLYGEDVMYSMRLGSAVKRFERFVDPVYAIREGNESLVTHVSAERVRQEFLRQRDMQRHFRSVGRPDLVSSSEVVYMAMHHHHTHRWLVIKMLLLLWFSGCKIWPPREMWIRKFRKVLGLHNA